MTADLGPTAARPLDPEGPAMTYADRIPLTPPVPTRTDRLNDARRCHTEQQHRHTDGDRADARSDERAIRELTAELERTRRANGRLVTEVERARYLLATTRAELGRALDALATIRDGQERIDRALAAYDTTPESTTTPALGSPPPRAQDAPLTSAQLGEMSIRANIEQVEAIRHHARGYADAIAALRDDDRYMAWWSSTGVKPAGTVRQVLADYLETVGPDGPDVTKPMPEREG